MTTRSKKVVTFIARKLTRSILKSRIVSQLKVEVGTIHSDNDGSKWLIHDSQRLFEADSSGNVALNLKLVCAPSTKAGFHKAMRVNRYINNGVKFPFPEMLCEDYVLPSFAVKRFGTDDTVNALLSATPIP
jgi:hypothetical protein